jgi:molecular chaperone HtpG
MSEYNFGANILESLTTGMYKDSKIIYREYIQNACDQIDKAEQLGILRRRNENSKIPDLGEGIINIWLDHSERRITIEDNATGIKANDFKRILGNIADSDKIMGKDKGFRGIGRLCGLAYCNKLVLTSRYAGEDKISIMTCDAHMMREMINETNSKVKKHSAEEVLNAMIEFTSRKATEEDASNFFKVELIQINSENKELFSWIEDDGYEQLAYYLSFVAPVPYHADFLYRSEIYSYAKALNIKIDEYNIQVNGQQIFKKYKTYLKTGNGQDDVYGVEFQEFRGENNSILAWMWFGKTSFKAAIKDEEKSRGLRLRKENIQIGDESTLRDMFTREASKRGNNYFIGEIFAISPELIPNSQRTYFNENQTRIIFENKLKNYFDNTLYNIYYDGSDTSASLKKITTYGEAVRNFEKKKTEGFVTTKERETEERALEEKKMAAEKAKKSLEKKRSEGGKSILGKEIVERRLPEINYTNHETSEQISIDLPEANEPYSTKEIFLTQTMFPSHNKAEQKLLSKMLDKIFFIIRDTVDKKTSETIINRIRTDLK